MGLAGDAPTPRLVEAAAAGDEEALATIMALHDADMARVCMVICGDPATARDAVQAAWPIVWRRLGSLRDPHRLRSWLISVAANEARQLVRGRWRRRRYENAVPPAPSEDPAGRAEYVDLAAALGRLDPSDRRLVALRYVAGLTSSEIAHEVGGTAAAVRGRLARVIARLRRELADA